MKCRLEALMNELNLPHFLKVLEKKKKQTHHTQNALRRIEGLTPHEGCVASG